MNEQPDRARQIIEEMKRELEQKLAQAEKDCENVIGRFEIDFNAVEVMADCKPKIAALDELLRKLGE